MIKIFIKEGKGHLSEQVLNLSVKILPLQFIKKQQS